eukprot:357225-Chlamydomonas_euryale.AAC.6
MVAPFHVRCLLPCGCGAVQAFEHRQEGTAMSFWDGVHPFSNKDCFASMASRVSSEPQQPFHIPASTCKMHAACISSRTTPPWRYTMLDPWPHAVLDPWPHAVLDPWPHAMLVLRPY